MSDDMGDDDQKRTANLARIRDNQRRSRARRKEYLAELEVKYRSCEQTGVEASAELQAAARKVLDENKRLRQLLKQQGLSDTEIDAYLSDRPENPQFPSATTVALENMIGQRRPCRSGSSCESVSSTANKRQSTVATQGLPPLQAALQTQQTQHLTSHHGSHASPQSASTSGAHTPSTLQLPALQSQPQMYNMESVPHLPALDQGISFDDAFLWPDQYTTPQASTSTETSSCYVAAEAIRSMKPDIGYDLEAELGCGDGRECHVPNSQIFGIMDRYSSGPAG